MNEPTRTTLAAALLAAALLAAGCGPSSGGTGSGGSIFVTKRDVCLSNFADALDCKGSGSVITTPDDIGQGTQVSRFADLATGGNVAVTFQAHQIELKARCQRLTFNGTWGITDGASDARFFGSYLLDNGSAEVLASISVQTLPGGALQVVMRESDGRLVLGPVVLQKVPAPVAQPAACP